MGSKYKPKAWEDEQDPYDGYDVNDDMYDDLDGIKDLSKGFYSTEWEDPSGSERRFSTRRKIERRNDLKKLLSELVEWDDINLRDEFDLNNDW